MNEKGDAVTGTRHMWGAVGVRIDGGGEGYTDAESGVSVLWTGVFRENGRDTLGSGPVIVRAWHDHGLDFPRYIQGDFAIVIHDPVAGRTVLARDPVGTVPLYYARDREGGLIFGTGIRDLLPGLGRISLEPRKLLDYLTYFWSVDEATFFKGIFLVPQGSVWCNGHIHTYFTFDHKPEERSENEWCDEIVRLLTEATLLHAGAGLGCHLSGGVDSSVLAVLLARQFARIPAFVASFPEYKSYDEARFAQMVADSVGIELRCVKPGPEHLLTCFSDLILTAEEPKCHPPVFPRFMLEGVAAKGGVKMMVSGRGADELFSGYEWHRECQLPDHRQRRTLFSHTERQRLLRCDFIDSVEYNPEEAYARLFDGIAGSSLLERILALDFRTLLANWLVLDHKFSVRFGMRPIAPFLDQRVVELALKIPVSLKRRHDEPKALLKQAVSYLLPDEVITRPKSGFRTPLGEMMRAGLEGFVRETLVVDDSVFWDIFEPGGVEAEMNAHFSGLANRGWQLWALLSLKQWCRLFLDSEAWR